MGWILALAVLILITLVGHVMWLIAAAILRALFGSSSLTHRFRPFNLCPACRENIQAHDRECSSCGFGLDTRTAIQLARVRVTEAEMRSLTDSGDLDAAISSKVFERLERKARVLQGLPAGGRRNARGTAPEVVRLAPPDHEAPSLDSPVAEPASTAAGVPDTIPAMPAPAIPTPAPAIPTPAPPGRKESVLAGFMESHNILWGEVAGGILIVGCSIALVITLWNRLEAIPFFPFLLSTTVTLALYGAGHYTLHRWKLETTSRGLLAIALLLVPLNLLLLSELVTRAEVSATVDAGMKLGAVALFAWVVRGGGRDVLTTRPDWRWFVALAVVGAPAAQLLPMSWFAGWRTAVPAWLGLACFIASLTLVIRTLRDTNGPGSLPGECGASLLQFVGLAAFALTAAWGLHIARSPIATTALQGLALPLAFAAMPVVNAGLLVHRRVHAGGIQTMGTAMALAGLVIMSGAHAAAWPAPLPVLLVSTVVGLFLTRAAFRESFAWAHGFAVPALSLAAVVGSQGVAGQWATPLVQLLGEPASGLVLVGVALTLGTVAEALARHGSRIHAVSYAIAGAATGLVGLLNVSVNGPEYPVHAAIANFACSLGLLASNVRWRSLAAAHVGLWLALTTTVWVMQAVYPAEYARWVFAVSVDSLALAGLALVLKGTHGVAISHLRRAGRDVSIAATVLVGLGMAAVSIDERTLASPWHTGSLLVLVGTGLTLARLTGAPVATYLAAAFGYFGVVHHSAYSIDGQPELLSYLVGFLALGTIAILAAVLSRRQERVFALPLRRSAQVISATAALVLLVPPAEFAFQWAGCAAWLGLVWLAISLMWRERGAFGVYQVAWTAAAVLAGVAWLNAQDWRPDRSIGYFEPAALQVYAVAIGLLGLVWVAARRVLRGSTTARNLWTGRLYSAERIVLSSVIVAHLLLVTWAILPEISAELRPEGWVGIREHSAALAQAFGSGAWVTMSVLMMNLVISWRLAGGERDTDWHILNLALIALAAPVVWGGTHAFDIASATALRWGFGVAFVAGTAVLTARIPVRAGMIRAGFPYHPTTSSRLMLQALLAVMAGVVVAISAQVAEIGLAGMKPSGPVAGSPFTAMGTIAANLVPLALVVLGLAGMATRECSPGYAFAGGAVFTATLAAGYALAVVSAGLPLDAPAQVRVWLLMVGGAAIWAAAWLAVEHCIPGGLLLAVQSRIGLYLLGAIGVYFALGLVARPNLGLGTGGMEFGRLGWLALALSAGVTVWHSRRSEPRLTLHALAQAAMIAGVLAASAAQSWDRGGTWLSFHVLALAWSAAGIGLGIAGRRSGVTIWLEGISAALIMLAIRSAWHDPWRPWIPATLAAVPAALVGASAVLRRSVNRAVVSGLLINLAAILLWLPSESDSRAGLLLANAAGLAVAAAAWTLISLREPAFALDDFKDLTRGVALVLLVFGLMPTLFGDRVDSPWLVWGAALCVVASFTISLWDPRARMARGGLLSAVAMAVLLGVSATTTRPVWDVAQTPLALAALTLMSSGLGMWASRARDPFFRIPVRGDSWVWLVVAIGVIGSGVIVMGVRISLVSQELSTRLVSPLSVLVLACALALQVHAMPVRATGIRLAVTGLAVLVFATAAWAYPDPAGVAPWLQRNGWLFMALAAAGTFAGRLGCRLDQEWQWATRAAGGISAALAVTTLGIHLAQQIPLYDRETRHTPLEPVLVFAMLAGILALIVLAIRFALWQNLDPLGMRDDRRTVYVYVAELLIIAFFTQIRFNVPELFLGQAVRYWTFSVMGLAFAGIGLAEYFERRRMSVLASPLRRTGVLLPLIPLLAFWAKPPAFLTELAEGRAPGLSPFLTYLEKLPQHFDTYAWLWFLAGGVYGLVALSKKSFGWALLAALATNAALWSLLRHHEVPFFVHPQAWAIQLAMIVLVSEQVNRRRLRTDVSNAMRYFGVAMIYVASAADMFIAGVGQSVWLPVVLAVFCVAGVLAGIMLRVRAFIFLGLGFLFLDIFAMIWHAAVNLEQTWVWYASGIILGVAILALFAVLEKRKKKQTEG